MPKEKLILRPQDTKTVQLPGTLSLPDGRKPVKLGSGTISSLISAGGMAIVYEIWNPELEVKRAVKLLKPDHTLESEDRFHTEMKITAKLHHPNIVEIYTVGTWDNLPYIEMELIDGVTLEKLIEESGGLPPEVCTSIGIMVGRALNYAHNQNYVLYGKRYQGVIHRDLKPGNIMVAKDGVAKLMDFGIAKPMTASIHTLEGMVMGTMQYLAPEQLDGKEVDVRADLYSLGTVLYEMVTGIRAFPEEKLGKLVTDKLDNNYVPLTKFSTRVPASLAGLIHHCIRYDKERRVQNSLEFLRAICRTHKTLTLKAPEQVLESFLASRGGEKRIVRVRTRSPVLPALIWTCTAIALIATATLVGLWVQKPALARQLIAQINLSGLLFARRSTARPGNTQDLGNLVDSILALQRPAHAEDIVSAADSGGDAAHGKPVSLEKAPQKPAMNESYAPQRHGPGPKRLTGRNARPAPQAEMGETSAGSGTAGVAESRLSEKLRRQLRTSDVMTVFSSEVEAGHFANGIVLYNMLPAGLADSRKALLYKLRALKGAGDSHGVRDFLEANNFNDGELLLEKARWCYTEKAFTAAYDFVKQASVSPAQFVDPRAFRELLLYSKALCASALYDARPNADTRKEAMEAWFDVKSLFKTSPEHKYFVKADAEIRRISAHVAVR
jgi:hypothetical protein